MKNALLLITALTALAGQAGATIVFTESFGYPDGSSLITAPGSPWTHTSGNTPGEVDVIAGKVNITASETEDVGAAFTTAGTYYDSGTLTATFDIVFTALPTSAGTYFAHFKDSANGFRGRVYAQTLGAAAGSFRLAIADTTTTVASVPMDLALNTSYSLTLSLNAATGRSSLAINGGTAVQATDTTTPVQISAFGLRQNTGEGTLTLDNIIIDATGLPVPEPSTGLTLLGGASVLFSFRRLRRGGRSMI